MSTQQRRLTAPWKGRLGTGKGFDRRYTGRVDRAIERGQYTASGTPPNRTDPDKVKRKKLARNRWT